MEKCWTLKNWILTQLPYTFPGGRSQQLLRGCSLSSGSVTLSSIDRGLRVPWLFHKPRRSRGCSCPPGCAPGVSHECARPQSMSTAVLVSPGLTSCQKLLLPTGTVPPGGSGCICGWRGTCSCFCPPLDLPLDQLVLYLRHHVGTFGVALACI